MKRTLLSFAAVVLLSMPAGSSPAAGVAMVAVAEDGAILVGAPTADGEDVTAPELVSLSWTPTTIDTSANAQTITVTARITDDLSGTDSTGACQGRFVSPNGQQFRDFILSSRTSGTAMDGTYQYTITIPAFAESGVWTLEYVLLVDQVRNTRVLYTAALAAAGFPTTFTQTGVGDATAPELVSLSWTPTTIDTSANAQTITVTARITDDLSGTDSTGACQGRFVSPNGQQFRDFILSSRTSGTAMDGTYQYTITIPAFAESGVWTLEYVLLVDQVRNTRVLYTAALAAAGFPTTFTQAAATTITLTSAPTTSVFGETVTLTASVSSLVGTPTGLVRFRDGSTSLGSVILSGGSATLALDTLSAGTHELSADYLGDGAFATSTSPSVSNTVSQATTTTVLQSAPNPAKVGQPVTLTATVSPNGSSPTPPTGSVTYRTGKKVLGAASLTAGVATLVTTGLKAGTYTITASYAGDGNFIGGISNSVSQQVKGVGKK